MRPPGVTLHLMENHSTALLAWLSHGVRDARCVHLDAHLDVGWVSPEGTDSLAPGGPGLCGLQERDCFLHTQEGLFDIASWLGVALSAGMVSELFWVVPDELWFDRPRQLQDLLLRQVGRATADSVTGLGKQDGPYRFTVHDTELTVCRLTELPFMGSGPVVLDIDLDYFARYRAPGPHGDWSTPWTAPEDVVTELHTRVPGAEVTTLSLSRHGGYLPEPLYAQVASLCHGAEPVPGGDVWHRADDMSTGPYADYTRACGLLHRNRPAEALEVARRAAAAAPEIGAYHYAVALGADATGDLAGATEAIDRCIVSGTVESAQVLNDFAGMAARAGDLDTALARQHAAFALDRADNPIISGNLMALHAQAGQWDRAQELALTTVDRQPFNSAAFVVLATAAQHHGDTATAAEAWGHAADIALDSRSAAGYRRRAARLGSQQKEICHVGQ